jgi:transposase
LKIREFIAAANRHRLLWAFCNKINLQIHVGNAAHIKWSFGIARGKNDKIDAIRLCKYACKESDELKMSKPLNPKLIQLKDLQTSRTRLLSQKNANETYLKELNGINDKATQKSLDQAYKTAIEGLKKSIVAIEKLIKELIESDKNLQKSYDLLLSVPGIGNITAIYLIVCTNNFSGNISGKQLASYAGVAPFGNSSGTSIKKPEKVHKIGTPKRANKELKKILHMGAIATAHRVGHSLQPRNEMLLRTKNSGRQARFKCHKCCKKQISSKSCGSNKKSSPLCG